jgi:hypothetical protein
VVLSPQLCGTRKEGKGKNMCANALVISWFPNHKRDEATQVFLKVYGTAPSYIKVVGDSPYVTAAKEGVKAYTLYEFPDEKMGQAVKEIAKMMTKFDPVVGYSWTAEVVLGTKESLALGGMKLPTR